VNILYTNTGMLAMTDMYNGM